MSVVDLFQGVEEVVPLRLRQVSIVSIGVHRMAQIYDNKFLVVGGKVIDLLYDVFERLAIAAEPNASYGAVVTGYPLTSGEYRAEIKKSAIQP